MKPYFAKYLPVEGEIKSKEKFMWMDNNSLDVADIELTPSIFKNQKELNLKPVKLFLCSRDVKVGDTVYKEPPFNTEYELKKQFVGMLWVTDLDLENPNPTIVSKEPLKGYYKVIGEISPNAKWVKEGDEFDNKELALILSDGFNLKFEDIRVWVDDFIRNYPIAIKCPCCNTFV